MAATAATQARGWMELAVWARPFFIILEVCSKHLRMALDEFATLERATKLFVVDAPLPKTTTEVAP